MNQYPAKHIADELAKYGRFGDTRLIHVNEIELQGIASLVPGGKLTTNPVTGQPEAFLPLLIPLLASYGGTAAAGALGASAVTAAIAGGAASGMATTAITGDLKRGLASGIMGAGMGAAVAGAGGAANAAVPPADLAVEGFSSAVLPEGINVSQALATAPETALASPATSVMEDSLATGIDNALSQKATFGEQWAANMKAPFKEGSGFTGEMMKTSHMLPMGIGAGQLAQFDREDKWDKQAKELQGDRDADMSRAYSNLQGSYRDSQPNARTGASPYRTMMSRNTPPPVGYARGGPTEGGSSRGRYNTYRGVDYRHNNPDNPNFQPAATGYDAYTGIDPVTIQRGLNPGVPVAPPAGWIPGFNPEFRYNQLDPENVQVPAGSGGPEQWVQKYAGFPSSSANFNPSEPYFKNVLPVQEKAGGGEVMLNSSSGSMPIAGGGIADVPTEFSQPQQQPQGQPAPEDVQMLAQALTGQADQPDQIVEMFVQKYGPEVFAAIREMILQSIQPGSQTQGMVQGPGGGMDDQVMGTIGGNQPVAVSPGEYIVPADVVSGLGDGSSDSGAQELDQMMNNVRQARQGGIMSQPGAVNARSMMPK